MPGVQALPGRPHPRLRAIFCTVDDHAAPRRTIVIGVRVGVDPQRHPHLRRGETHAGCGIHRLEHVGDQGADLVRDLFDDGCGGVQDGIAHDANRENSHALSLSSDACG